MFPYYRPADIDALNRQAVTLLKLDCEGSELAVLAGIDREDPALWGRIQQVVAEVHDVDGRPAAVAALLRARGFESVVEDAHAVGRTGGPAGNVMVYARRAGAAEPG